MSYLSMNSFALIWSINMVFSSQHLGGWRRKIQSLRSNGEIVRLCHKKEKKLIILCVWERGGWERVYVVRLCVCMCVSVWLYVGICTCSKHLAIRGLYQLSFPIPLCFVNFCGGCYVSFCLFYDSLSQNLKLADLARPAGQETSGIPQSWPLQH